MEKVDHSKTSLSGSYSDAIENIQDPAGAFPPGGHHGAYICTDSGGASWGLHLYRFGVPFGCIWIPLGSANAPFRSKILTIPKGRKPEQKTKEATLNPTKKPKKQRKPDHL